MARVRASFIATATAVFSVFPLRVFLAAAAVPPVVGRRRCRGGRVGTSALTLAPRARKTTRRGVRSPLAAGTADAGTIVKGDPPLRPGPQSASFSRPRTFGEALLAPGPSSSVMTSYPSPADVSCPCCAFLGPGLFLPPGEGVKGGGEGEGGPDNAPPAAAGDAVLSPSEALRRIASAAPDLLERDTAGKARHNFFLVDTHGHPHLEREAQYADEGGDASERHGGGGGIVSLTCAVSPADWDDALDHSSRSNSILPALGVHPWYLADLESSHPGWIDRLEELLVRHPSALVGEIGLCKMARFVRTHPDGKAAALAIQKDVFERQFRLAAKHRRPVTVHCVNMHGMFLKVLKEIKDEVMTDTSTEPSSGAGKPDAASGTTPIDATKASTMQRRLRAAFPPAVAMHSFTGTAHHVREILAFEKELLNPAALGDGERRFRKSKGGGVADPANGDDVWGGNKRRMAEPEPLFYFGFSHAVNHVMCTSEKARRKQANAVRAVPTDRLLVESDVHRTADVALGTAGAAAYVAHAVAEGTDGGGEDGDDRRTGEHPSSLEGVARRTTRNGLRFLGSVLSDRR